MKKIALIMVRLAASMWADDSAAVKGYESHSVPQDIEGIGDDFEITCCGDVQVPVTEL